MSSQCSSCPLKILVTTAENMIDSTCRSGAPEEHADEQGNNRHFEKNANTTNSGNSRSPAQSRNVDSRGLRVRQVCKIRSDTLKEKIFQRFILVWEPTIQIRPPGNWERAGSSL
ncbi:unnamed protein product [Haemonchus placei]|uniref:Uncharacterized protein n=1 Tax=Haemonchus placei TaxID=6290 RepID=A0A0N4WVN1_HAEPC|nr:unnamed protein product [Haemonchus placei]